MISLEFLLRNGARPALKLQSRASKSTENLSIDFFRYLNSKYRRYFDTFDTNEIAMVYSINIQLDQYQFFLNIMWESHTCSSFIQYCQSESYVIMTVKILPRIRKSVIEITENHIKKGEIEVSKVSKVSVQKYRRYSILKKIRYHRYLNRYWTL